MPKYVCDGCPCMNSDNEYGSECNLGYTIIFNKTDEDWHKWQQQSTDCKLVRIITQDKVIENEVINA